jgi:WD40 repeat protein
MIHVRRWLTACVFGGLALGLSACDRAGSSPGRSGANGEAPPPPEIGSALYAPAPMPPAPKVTITGDPIVVANAVVQNSVRVQIPAPVDGTIELIATPLPAGTKIDPNDPDIVYHPRDLAKDPGERQAYRRLKEGDPIKKGQLLARIDEQIIQLQIAMNEDLIQTNNESIKKAEVAADAYRRQLLTIQELRASGKAGISEFEVLGLMATVARLELEVVQTKREKVKAEGDLATAKAQLAKFFVRSEIDGRVVKLLKNPQEYARAGEVIMEIQASDRIRIEGKLDAQYARLVHRGMPVIVEPARPVGPDPVSISHRMEVTGIAVTAHDKRPLIVSVGLDSSALVWDPFGSKQYIRLAHPAGVGVRSVACTGKSAKGGHLIVTGSEDGKIRLWTATDPEKLVRGEPDVFEEGHSAAITALAFSPDGRYLATASGRDVFLWSVADRKKLYALPLEHRDAVTSLRFTPQTTLLTVSRDRSVRVWRLGETGAATQSVLDHRGGSVDVLGVSSDGGRVLFDKDPGRIDVVSLADERSVGTLQSATGGGKFSTLAMFSPDDQLILTAGGDTEQRGELMVWRAPQTGGRAAEGRRLMTPRGSTITCAAFSPDEDKKFVAVGTSDGGVYFWTPRLDEKSAALVGEVTWVAPSDPRTFLLRVELANPSGQAGEGLQERSLATLIVNPTGAAASPASAAVVPTSPVVPAGGVLPPAAVPTGGIPPVTAPPVGKQ